MSHKMIDGYEVSYITPRDIDAPPVCVFHGAPELGEPYAYLATFNRAICRPCLDRIFSVYKFKSNK